MLLVLLLQTVVDTNRDNTVLMKTRPSLLNYILLTRADLT